MTRLPELPPAAKARRRRYRPRTSEHHRLVVVDDNEADILARAYALHRNASEDG